MARLYFHKLLDSRLSLWLAVSFERFSSDYTSTIFDLENETVEASKSWLDGGGSGLPLAVGVHPDHVFEN